MYSSTVAGRPGHQTERRANASVLSRLKWPPSGRGMKLRQDLEAQPARGGDAESITTRATAIEQPVAQKEGTMILRRVDDIRGSGGP